MISRSVEPNPTPPTTGPPTTHQLAVMIWLAVFPTLTGLNLVLGDWLRTLTPVVRTFVLATVAVPIVIYGLMPQLHRIRRQLLTRAAHSRVLWRRSRTAGGGSVRRHSGKSPGLPSRSVLPEPASSDPSGRERRQT